MLVTVKDVYDVIDSFAPFDTQEEWDNSGILAGNPENEVTRVLCALDLTKGVISEAVRRGAELIVTHHPILFHARKNIRGDDPEGALICELARSGAALIAAHTNFDIAPGGVNDTLAEILGLENVRRTASGLRVGDLGGTLGEISARAERALKGVVRRFGAPDAPVNSVGVCGGAGGSLWKDVYDAGADCFVTGEIHHNDALDLTAWGMTALEAGHYQTEVPSVKALKMALQKRFDELQYKVMVFGSDYEPF